MKRFLFLACLAFLLLPALAGIASADSPAAATTVTVTTPVATPVTMTATPAAATITPPGNIGGSISFETDPPGAMIWLDGIEIAKSPITHYTEKAGTLDVLIIKKGFEDYRDSITVIPGQRITYSAVLTKLTYDLSATDTPDVIPVTTAVPAIRRSTLTVPTPWPTPAPASPVDPAVVLGAAVLGTGFFVVRRR